MASAEPPRKAAAARIGCPTSAKFRKRLSTRHFPRGTMERMNVSAILLVLLLSASTATAAAAGDAARAILESQCLNCHGQAQTAGLDLHQIDSIAKGGKRGPAIVPGNAEHSLLYKAVAHSGDLQMPPGKPLSADEIATLRNWINEGAHWDSVAAKEP